MITVWPFLSLLRFRRIISCLLGDTLLFKKDKLGKKRGAQSKLAEDRYENEEVENQSADIVTSDDKSFSQQQNIIGTANDLS